MKKSKIYHIITIILGIALINGMLLITIYERFFEIGCFFVFNTFMAMAITGFVAISYKHKNQ
jgi:hypothetical protein